MVRLSSSIGRIKDHYTVVVVGSGYGGGIAASRLARAGQQVCVLERGREIQPGEYPDGLASALSEMQATLPVGHVGSQTALFDFNVNKDINVLVGCGLGGTSLINANVSLRAESRIFDDPRWPSALREDESSSLDDGYRHAAEMLKPSPYPVDSPSLPKLRALEDSADYMEERFYRPPINVTFQSGVNHVGVQQQACTLCGDCVSGCNYGAKNTTLMNYLPDATNHGAEIFTLVSVRRVERAGDRWLVHYELVDSGREKFDAPAMFVTADIVVLAAGALGSTEILLRSKAAGLDVSGTVGHNFSGNADTWGFGYNTDQEINGIGMGDRSPKTMDPVGPCITGIIDMRNSPELEDGIVIEEGSTPGGLGTFLPPFLAAAAAAIGKDTDRGFGDWIRERLRVWHSMIRGVYHGAMRNTQTFLVMSHDDGAGRLSLEDNRLRVDWPGVGAQPVFERVNQQMKNATRPLGGTYVRNPTWSSLTNHNVVTVHPLGGCVMAEDGERGVVNHKGQVFSGSQGVTVHEGLYVADGAVVPRSLGVNPLLTISALAERTCALMAQDRSWKIDYDLPSAPAKPSETLKLGLQFTETMRGHVSDHTTSDYEQAAMQGERDDSPFEFTLTIVSDDLDAMLESPEHEAAMVGSVVAPALSDYPLTATDGLFNLLVVDPDQPDARQMQYRMKLRSVEGRRYYFYGFKTIHDDPGFDMWTDTTTLFITVREGEDAEDPLVGKGILKIKPNDFRRQMTTMQVNNADNVKQRIEATARFGRFFAGELWDTYGIM